jgi:hypothetical protein
VGACGIGFKHMGGQCLVLGDKARTATVRVWDSETKRARCRSETQRQSARSVGLGWWPMLDKRQTILPEPGHQGYLKFVSFVSGGSTEQ